jgi:hypothetical protein
MSQLDRLKSQLLTSGIQQENIALFQVINQLIDYIRATTTTIQASIGGGGGGGGLGLTGATYLTKNKEVALSNSLQELAGAGIQFNDANGRRIVSVARPFVVESEQNEDSFPGFPIKGDKGDRGLVGIGIPGIDGLDGEDGSVVAIPGPTGPQGNIGNTGMPGFDGFDGEEGPVSLLGIFGLISSLTLSPLSVVTTAVDYSILPTDYIILATAALTLTLPATAGLQGKIFYIKDMAADGLEVTVATTGGATIDDSATQIMAAKYTTMQVGTDGTNWFIL